MRLELVRLSDGQLLSSEAFEVESRTWLVDIEGNELLLLHLGRDVLPRAIARIVGSLASAEDVASPAP